MSTKNCHRIVEIKHLEKYNEYAKYKIITWMNATFFFKENMDRMNVLILEFAPN